MVGEALFTGESYLAIVTPLNDVLGNARRVQAPPSSQGKNLLIRVSTVETNSPKISDTASPEKIEPITPLPTRLDHLK